MLGARVVLHRNMLTTVAAVALVDAAAQVTAAKGP
jgi:hypothetical protein